MNGCEKKRRKTAPFVTFFFSSWKKVLKATTIHSDFGGSATNEPCCCCRRYLSHIFQAVVVFVFTSASCCAAVSRLITTWQGWSSFSPSQGTDQISLNSSFICAANCTKTMVSNGQTHNPMLWAPRRFPPVLTSPYFGFLPPGAPATYPSAPGAMSCGKFPNPKSVIPYLGNNKEAQMFLSRGAQVIIRMRGLPYNASPNEVVSHIECLSQRTRFDSLPRVVGK